MTPTNRLYRSPAQAATLVEVIEREARWRNLPADLPGAPQANTTAVLVAKQRAYEVFREALAVYNRLHRPAYREFWPVRTPASLARWCRSLAELLCGAGLTECPTALLEQAFRRAEKLACRIGVGEVFSPPDVAGVAEAVAALVEIARWSEGVAAAPNIDRVAA
jgi:hypothetical protein